MSILVVGSIAYDTIETPSGKMVDTLGGSTMYFSAAASLFTPVHIVGVVGSDFDHKELDFLKQNKVDFEGLYTETGKTFRWGGTYHQNMNQRDTLFTYLNVFENFKPMIPDKYKNLDYIFLANIDPQLQLEVLAQVNRPKVVVLDTMNFWITGRRKHLDKVIAKSNIVIINDEELVQYTGETNFVAAAKKISSLGPSHLVIKRGEYGAVLYTGNSFFFVPAFPLEHVVDPTGAGDTFAGGFLGHIASEGKTDEKTLKNAIIFGCTTASFTVEDFSLLRLKKLSRNELVSRFEQLKKLMTI